MPAKKGFDLKSCKGVLKAKINDRGWALCIGAGTSRGVFPTWDELVRSLMDTGLTPSISPEVFANLSSSYSLDALIEGAKTKSGLSDGDFIKKLGALLYRNFRSRHNADWKTLVNGLSAAGPGSYVTDFWTHFIEIFQDNYPSTPAWILAETVCDSLKERLGPSAIISFNAEPLLFALINAYAKVNWRRSSETAILDAITHSTSSRGKGRVPYYFCHGYLPIPNTPKGRNHLASPDKLVFSEGEYLGLSNSVFSWQAAQFLSLAVTHSMVFIGLSFRDSNLRRWLSWAHANRLTELRTVHKYQGSSTIHYWIRKRPIQRGQESWEESCVAHLGVRIVWLDDWSELRTAFRGMLRL